MSHHLKMTLFGLCLMAAAVGALAAQSAGSSIRTAGKCVEDRFGGTLHLTSPSGLPPKALYRTELWRITAQGNAPIYSRSFGIGVIDVLGQPSGWDLNCGGTFVLKAGKYQVKLIFIGNDLKVTTTFRVSTAP